MGIKDILNFPANIPPKLRAEVKQYLACQESVKILEAEINQTSKLTHALRLTERKERAERTIRDFEDKYLGGRVIH